MNVLFLTYNPTGIGTVRIVKCLLEVGRAYDLNGFVALRPGSAFASWLAKVGVNYIFNPMPWPSKSKPWVALWHVVRLARWARRHHVALVHCNEQEAYPFGSLLAGILRCPVICHVRCKLSSGFTQWAFKRRAPSALIWCSPNMRAECGDAVASVVPNERQFVVPLSVDVTQMTADAAALRDKVRQQWGIRNGEVVVGTASALRPGKRLEDFLEIARRLRRNGVRFVLAGGPIAADGEYGQSIVSKINAAASAGIVTWMGHVEPVETFLRGIDIYLSTSEHESFGMSVCEAMACGHPVVAYRACSVQYVVGDGGLIVDTGDVDGLCGAVQQLVSDPQLRHVRGVRARQRVIEEFDPRGVFLQMRAVYDFVLSQRLVKPAKLRRKPAPQEPLPSSSK